MEKVTVYQDDAGEWRWRRQAGNNEIISTSGEGYVDRDHAQVMAARLNPDAEIVTQDD
jgi:uncharacterized protein YegP (UPF0339 family)